MLIVVLDAYLDLQYFILADSLEALLYYCTCDTCARKGPELLLSAPAFDCNVTTH